MSMNRFVLKRIVTLDARARELEQREIEEGGGGRTTIDPRIVDLRQEICRLTREHLGPSHPWRLSRLFELAASCRRADQPDKAEIFYLEGIRQIESVDIRGESSLGRLLARALNGLGVLYCETRREIEAIPLLERALGLLKWDRDERRQPARAAIASNLASAHHALGHFDLAEVHYRTALSICQRAGSSMRLEQIHGHCDLAELWLDAGRSTEAERQARLGLALLDDEAAPGPAQGRALHRLARIFQRLDRPEAAARLFERAALALERGGTALEWEHADCLDASSELHRLSGLSSIGIEE
jgi:tetratricopeptide (TPR) repeat protein